MGTILKIKNADFSAVEITTPTWIVNELDQTQAKGYTPNSNAAAIYAGFSPNYDFGGKTINVLQFYAGAAGYISVCIGASYSSTNYTIERTLFVFPDEVGTIVTKQIEPLTIPNGKKLWLGKTTDTGLFKYVTRALSNAPYSTYGPFWVACGTSAAYQNDKSEVAKNECLSLNIGYKHKNIKWAFGYNSAELAGASPFTYNTGVLFFEDDANLDAIVNGKTITHIKINASGEGKIYYGRCSRTSPFTQSEQHSIDIPSAGVQVIQLENPIVIDNDYSIGVNGSILKYITTSDETKGWRFRSTLSGKQPENDRICIDFGYL